MMLVNLNNISRMVLFSKEHCDMLVIVSSIVAAIQFCGNFVTRQRFFGIHDFYKLNLMIRRLHLLNKFLLAFS